MFKRKLKVEKPKSRVQEMWEPLAESFAALEREQIAEAQARARKNAPPPPPPKTPRTGEPLIDEAITINELLKDSYKIPAEVRYERQPDSIQLTPRHRLFRLAQIKPYRIDDLIGRLDDMGGHIKAGSRKNRGPDVTAGLVPTQPPWLQVTRPDPVDHPWSDRDRNLGPMTATIGDWWLGPKRVPALIKMFGDQAVHVCGLFCGGLGSGKTATLRRALLSLMENNSPDKLHIYIVETKSPKSYRDFAGLRHVKQIVSSIDDVMPLLEQFKHWCSPEGEPDDGAMRLLVFDEFQDAVENDEDPKRPERIMTAMKRIMAKCRSMGVRVWIATQVPDKACFPPRLKALCQFMVVGYIQNDQYMRNPLGIYGSSGLTKSREFLFVDDDAPTVITAHWLPADELAHELDRLRGGGPVSEIGGPVVSGGQPVPENRWTGGFKTGGPVVLGSATRVKGDRMENFPLTRFRSLTPDECAQVREMAVSGMSLNKLCIAVYGGKDTLRLAEIKRALGKEKRNGTKTKSA